MTKRRLKPNEISFLIKMLGNRPEVVSLGSQLPQRFVEEMDDGGMGGLTFVSPHENRHIGSDLASVEFFDEDGVAVIVTLSLDNYGDLYELDIWKTDFSPLRRLPG
ncbi:DUF6984 family protein [Cupriavidus basilensis]